MAIITQKRTWNNIPVRIETNNETAEVKVYADTPNSGFFGGNANPLFTSEGKGSDWKITNPQNYTYYFNNQNGTRSTQKELERAFFLEGYKTFDNDRAAVLNNPENYNSARDAVISRERFYNQKTPRIDNPKTGLTIDSKGKPTNLPVTPKREQSPPGSGDAPPASTADGQGPGTAIGSQKTGSQVQVVDNNEQGSTPVDDSNKKPPTTSEDTTKPLTEKTFLRYPLANLDGLEELGISYDYIKIRVLDWKNGIDGSSLSSVTERYSQSKASLETIILPMVNNLSSTNGVGWGENNMNIIELQGARIIQNALKDVGNRGIKEIFGIASKAVQDAGRTLNSMIGDSVENKDSIASALAGYVVGNAGFLTRGSGQVINPNMELLFNGPKLRTFGFRFDFAPRFKEEAEVVRDIIKVLKARSSPSTSSANIFLSTPKVFELEYIYNGDGSEEASGSTHPYLNKIKPCALTQIDVNYTPNNKYMTYAEDGSMVATSLTMSFTELEPIYADDYSKTGHPAGY